MSLTINNDGSITRQGDIKSYEFYYNLFSNRIKELNGGRREVKVTKVVMDPLSSHDFVPSEFLKKGTFLGTYKGPIITVLEVLNSFTHLGIDHSQIDLVLDTDMTPGDCLYLNTGTFQEEFIVKGIEIRSIR